MLQSSLDMKSAQGLETSVVLRTLGGFDSFNRTFGSAATEPLYSEAKLDN